MWELLGEYFEVMMHDIASFEFSVIEVNDGELELGDVIKEFSFHDLHDM